MRSYAIVAVVIAGLCGHGCGNASSPAEDRAAPPASQEAREARGPIDVDACQFLDANEIASATGTSNLKAEPEEQPAGASGCRYRSMAGTAASVNVHNSDAKEFDEFRELIGAEAETVTDLGDAAYLWNPNRIYVRVGSRGFSVTVQQDMSGEKQREALLALARSGAEKMRALPPR